MEQLIPLINRLHDAFALVEGGSPIDLPQIVVVGSQSSGKSSVLENIVGRDFLPRGAGIVTRRPLILQLINIPKNDDVKSNLSLKTALVPAPGSEDELGKELDSYEWGEEPEWGEFLHRPNEKFFDFNEIREEIIRETDRVTGKNKGISHLPINLKIHSPKVLNLTLVDLPGITKVPIGDQPKDIELQIRKMIFGFIEKKNTVILAVTAANTDLTNSDALQIAREVDPEGKRTVGVLTKLDLMDKGTDAMDVLTGKLVPLRLGYIPVINRSQHDINTRKSIESALKSERDYFLNHPLYKSLANKCGTTFLSQSLNKILLHHIRECLPDMKLRINKMIADRAEELKAYGDPIMDGSPGGTVLHAINTFSGLYEEVIDGKLTDDTNVDELYGGARISFIFNEIFAKYLRAVEPTDGLTAYDIRTALTNATGLKSSLFIPDSAFESLVKRQIAKLREPALQTVDLVYDELEKIVYTVDTKELKRFQNLREDLVEAAVGLLKQCRQPTKEMINNLCNMELAFINTNHPDFHVDKVIGSVMQRRSQVQQPQQPSNPFEQPDNRTQQLLQSRNPQPQPPMQPQQPKQPVPPQQANQAAQSKPRPPQPQPSPYPEEQSGSLLNMFFGRQQPRTNPAQPSSNGYNDYNRSVKLPQMPSTLTVAAVPQQKEFEIELLESLLDAYFTIVRKNIQDAVPKAIMFFMVQKSKGEMQNHLVQKLYKEDRLQHLIQESTDITSKRIKCKNTLELLYKAQSILNEVRDFTPGSSFPLRNNYL